MHQEVLYWLKSEKKRRYSRKNKFPVKIYIFKNRGIKEETEEKLITITPSIFKVVHEKFMLKGKGQIEQIANSIAI